MIRVAVTGSECTGKTALAEALASYHSAVSVPEYARQFVVALGTAPKASDVNAIAAGQIALEQSHAEEAADLLILDTDLLSTIVYSRHYYGDCPGWIEERFLESPADLYLLCDIDVPWIPDGKQRDREKNRPEMQQLFRDALIDRKLDFVEIRGSLAERLGLATEAIEKIRSRV